MPPPPTPPPAFTTSLLPPPGPLILSTPMPLPVNPPSTLPPLFLSALKIRTSVFIHEQHCPAANELDADDARSWHWIVFAHTPGSEPRPAATMRMVPFATEGGESIEGVEEPDMAASEVWDGQEPFVKLGRLATLRGFRGMGVAKRLVEEALEWAGRHREQVSKAGEGGWKGLVLVHAQEQLEEWYAGQGFVRDKGLGGWVEEEIRHLGMWRRVWGYSSAGVQI